MPAIKKPKLATFVVLSIAAAGAAFLPAPEANAASAFYVDTSPSDHTCSVWYSRATGLALVYNSQDLGGRTIEILSKPCLFYQNRSTYADQRSVHIVFGDQDRVCDYTPTGEVINDRSMTTVRCHSKEAR